MTASEAIHPQTLLTNFLGVLPAAPGQVVQPLRTTGDVGIGTFDAHPEATLDVRSGEAFDRPQVQIVQTTPNDFARLRLVSTVLSTGDPDNPHPPQPTPAPFWDIAVGGDDVMNFFQQFAGNIMTLTPRGEVRVAVLEITGGADVAEPFATEETVAAEPGDVMVIDQDHPGLLRVSHTMYDRRVAGIVSGAGGLTPGVLLGAGGDMSGRVPVALSGRAWCKADARSNPITPGDLLTTASCRGHAMKAVDEQAARGAILGKAMSGLHSGRGLVLTLVNLQ